MLYNYWSVGSTRILNIHRNVCEQIPAGNWNKWIQSTYDPHRHTHAYSAVFKLCFNSWLQTHYLSVSSPLLLSLSLTLFRSYLTSRASAFWRLIELQICLPHKQQIFHFITRANLAVYQFCISGKLINILSARLLKEFVTPRILDCLLDFCLVSAQFEC